MRNIKAVAQYKDGKLVAKYSSITLASDLTNTQKAHIGKVCLSKRNTAGGYSWKYVKKMTERFTPAITGVSQYDRVGTLLAVYRDASTASDMSGTHLKNIMNVVTRKSKTAGGCVWR